MQHFNVFSCQQVDSSDDPQGDCEYEARTVDLPLVAIGNLLSRCRGGGDPLFLLLVMMAKKQTAN